MNMIEGRDSVDRGIGAIVPAESGGGLVVNTRRGRSLAVLVSGDELAALEDDLEIGVGSRLVA
ncbi:hypothetical protein FHR81_002488 [Actinoalloteichus hoggarensis]|uniref:Uncharacterized protein n=1 Tax=Actinoalloteichus hoggarensis TaxID=1470176 RepID=A0A221VXW1_9PSEU|nr:hypothetical protein [Actinoalloteichus hoggarensis]ASO18091.1 hypothetical protein AHOG_02135 [Actinoalloteichus hoggarensis]MBB5921448.1 hypothetical protein [Actinoalloteichus hoggarensis]